MTSNSSEKLNKTKYIQRNQQIKDASTTLLQKYVTRINAIKPNGLILLPPDKMHQNNYTIITPMFQLGTNAQDITKLWITEGLISNILNRRSTFCYNKDVINNKPLDIYYSSSDIRMSFEPRFELPERLISRYVPNALSMTTTKYFYDLEALHHIIADGRGWQKGCEADVRVTDLGNVVGRTKDKSAMCGYGVSHNCNVKDIKASNINNDASLKIYYDNRYGEDKSFQISSWLNRSVWTKKQLSSSIQQLMKKMEYYNNNNNNFNNNTIMKSMLNNSILLINELENLYRHHALDYLINRKWPHELAITVLNEIELCFSTLVVNNNISKIGCHKDPPSPFPALLAGPSTYSITNNKWEKVYNGGRLFYLDGLVDLSYCPYDVVMMDGNAPHGVSNIEGVANNIDASRFSIIMFTKCGRQSMKKYGMYDDMYSLEMYNSLFGVD
jgi:hypothetical protein